MATYPGKSAYKPPAGSDKPLQSRIPNVKHATEMPGDGGQTADIFSTSRTATPEPGIDKPLQKRS